MLELEAKFRQGLGLHQQGRLADAERIYQDVLRQRPDLFDAWYLLGVIALQTRRVELSAELFARAIALKPDHAEAHNNRGAALANSGRHEEALSHYDTVIALKPDHAAAFTNRGASLAKLGRLEEALSSYDRAIALKPDLAEAHTNHAAALANLGRPEEALASCDRAIGLMPDHAGAHYNRGNALRDLERFKDAVSSYDHVIALTPNHAGAHNNRGAALAQLGRTVEALSSFDRAIALQPDAAEAYNNQGAALADLGRLEEALSSYDRAIALKPDHAGAYKNRGSALAGLGRLEEALASCDRAIALKPDYAEAYANRAAALTNLGRIEEALLNCDRAIALRPDSAEARFNKGACHLALGDFERGWEGFEWRWKSRFGPESPGLSGLPWHGDASIEHKTILVYAEQGLGDSIQFCRYVPMLAAHARVILHVPRPLARLFSGLEGVAQVITGDDPPPRYDAWIPMMSLPLAFHTRLATVPAPIPYLYTDPELMAAWRRRLAALPGRKVGLVWAGSPFSKQPRAQAMDRRRSISLGQFAPLAGIPGLCLISLQKGEAAAQALTPPEGIFLHDWTEELDDYADTAALVEALDLVISVDTSVVHLAGTLGKPVWVLNRYDQCWRWLRDRTDSPWYPTARLFRQRAPGDWSGVISDVVEALAVMASEAKQSPRPP
jgi:tetratricopeptide (TPR) repeat protein